MKRRIVKVLLVVLAAVVVLWLFAGGGTRFLFSGGVEMACVETHSRGDIGLRPTERKCLQASPPLLVLTSLLLASASIALLAPVVRKP